MPAASLKPCQILWAAVTTAWLSGCAFSSPVGPVVGLDDRQGVTSGYFRRLVDHERDAWNPLGLWQRVATDPPTYAPVGTPAHPCLAEQPGTWLVDANDGWRFFVPAGGTPEHSETLLLSEARKITNRRSAAQNFMRNAALLPVFCIGLPLQAFAASQP